MTKTTSYSAEPDPSLSTCAEDPPLWRLIAWDEGGAPRVIGQGLVQEEARTCERALSALPGATPVDEVTRRRVEVTSAAVVGSAEPVGQVSSAPFVPYSVRDLAEVEHAAKMLLARQLASSAMMTESMARSVITMAEMLRKADPKLVPDGCLHLRVTRGKDVPRQYGSWRTQLCLDCGAFRTHGHNVWPDPSTLWAGHDWRPASEYAEATAHDDD